MPRTEHLSHLNPNKIYAIDAQVLYTHETPTKTTAIIQQEDSQGMIKIPGKDLRLHEGNSYHFGFCYIGNNGWISARHPNHSIQPSNRSNTIPSISLREIAENVEKYHGHYITTTLQVISVQPPQNITKDGNDLQLRVVKCFAEGHLIDLTIWNE